MDHALDDPGGGADDDDPGDGSTNSADAASAPIVSNRGFVNSTIWFCQFDFFFLISLSLILYIAT